MRKSKLMVLLAFAALQAYVQAGSVIYVTPTDGKIHNADGSELVIRGFNQNHWWGNQDQNTAAIQDVSKTGANTVRAVFGPDLYGIPTPDRGAIVQQYIINQHVNVIVEDQGATCAQDTQSLMNVVNRWLTPANLKWLKDPTLRGHIILNIANEWSGGDNYITAYQQAIKLIRHAGVKVPLLIDANGCGQNISMIYFAWQTLLQSDPEMNIIFDIHMYGGWATDGSPGHFDIQTEMDKAVALHIPLIVGEFSYNNGTNGIPYDTYTAMAIFNQRNIGWVAWSWNGNGVDTGMNMIAGTGWRLTDGLTPWGNLVIKDPNVGLSAP